MVDSDSDNFESADEGFSDVEDERLPEVVTPHSSGSITKETAEDDNVLFNSSDGNISSTLKNLSLEEQKLSLKNNSLEEKQILNFPGKSKPEENIPTEGSKTAVDKSKIVNSAKKVDVDFERNTNSPQSIVNSEDVTTNLNTTRSNELNMNISRGCSMQLSQFLQPACDSTPSSDRTDEFKSFTQTLSAEKPELENTIESQSSCTLKLLQLQSTQECCESNLAPTETGLESNLMEEDSNETARNDGWEIESTVESAIEKADKSTVEKNSGPQPVQSTNVNSENTSNCKPSTTGNFREENVNDSLWDDEWEVGSTIKETSNSVLLQSTDDGNKNTPNPRSSIESNATRKNDKQEVDTASAKISEVTHLQSGQLSSGKSILNPKSSLKSNVNEENVGESSWDDGWEVEDFETGSVDAKIETVINLNSSKKEISDDAGWEDGWDTEEVTFNPNLSKDSKPPSSRQKITEEEQTETLQTIDRENLCTNDKKISSQAVFNEQSKLTQQKQDGWFGWGVTNILSSATKGLSSITNNVTSAFETTIGAPDPTELLQAQKEADESEEVRSNEAKPQEGGFTENLFSVSSWTKFVESTGSKVLTTGLDTLETIGKKTMEVIQEGDPGLKKKRAKLQEFVAEPGKPVLSQVLREAKERAETSSRTNEAAFIESRVNFEILFDDFEGLVHLEALEMISKQCQIKLDSLALKFSGNEAKNFKETLQEIEELCELPEDDETNSKEAMADSGKFKLRVQEVLAQLGVDIQYDKLLQTNEIVESRLQKDYSNPLELHQIVISSLAEISAAAMQIFHRAAEMLVIKSKHSTIAETDSLMSFGKLVCSKLEVTAEKFSSKLKKIDPSDTAKISHISKEATNSTTYTQNACHLLVPILQYGAVV